MKIKFNIALKIMAWSFFVVLIALVTFYFFSLPQIKKTFLESKKENLTNVVDEALNVCKYYDSLPNTKHLSPEEFLHWKQKQAMTIIKNLKYGRSGYLWINDFEPKMIMHPHFSPEEKPEWYAPKGLIDYKDSFGLKLFLEFVNVCKKNGSGFVTYHWPKPGQTMKESSEKISYIAAYKPWGWIIGTGAYFDNINQIILTLLQKTNGINILATIVMMLLAILVSLSMSRPIKQATEFAETIKTGDLTSTLQIQTRDEIAVLGKSLSAMQEQLKTIASSLQSTSNELENASEILKNTHSKTTEVSLQQIESLNENAQIMEEIIEATEKIAEKSQNQSADIEEVTASVEELTASVTQVENTSMEVEKASKNSLQIVLNTEEASNQTIDSMRSIEESAKKIQKVTNVINDIADQTNLLALNASIEAARAGEAGRGFAVVAKEISNLADKSSSATKEIGTLISETNINVESGSEKLNNLVSSITGIKESLSTISQFAQSMAQASTEEKNGFEQISSAVQNVNSAAQDISELNTNQVNIAETAKRKLNELIEITDTLKQSISEIANSISITTEQITKLQQISSMFKLDKSEEA